MTDTPLDGSISRRTRARVAAGGAAGAAVAFVVRTRTADASAHTSDFPVAALIVIVVGCLLAGALLGTGHGHRRSRWASTGFGLACGLTSLGGYAALGLTVTAGPASVGFLVLTPLAALAAGFLGYAAARTVARRRSAVVGP